MEQLKKTLIITIVILFCAAMLVMGVNSARAEEYPNVAGLKPFTSQTAYLSLVGYLQYLAKNQNGKELTQSEAMHVINMQAKGKVVSDEPVKVKKVKKHRRNKKAAAVEPKAEVKAEVKAEEPKAEVKAEVKAEPKVEAKPEVKAEEKK